MNGAAEEGVHRPNELFDRGDGDDHTERGVQQGFTDKLDDQIAPAGAGNLADPNLDRASGGARRHQVDEIDTGNNDDQQTETRGGVDQRRINGGLFHLQNVGTMMKAGDRRKGKGIRLVRGCALGPALMLDEMRQHGLLQVRDLSTRFQAQICAIAAGAKTGCAGLRCIRCKIRKGRLSRQKDFGTPVGFDGQVLQHGCDPHGVCDGGILDHPDVHGLADRIVLTEIFASQVERDHCAVGRIERMVEIAIQDRHAQNFEDIGIGIDEGLGRMRIVAATGNPQPVLMRARYLVDLGKIEPHPFRHPRRRHSVVLACLAGLCHACDQKIGRVGLGQEAVETQLVTDEEADQNSGSEACGQPQDIDTGIEFIACQVAQRRRQIVAEHPKPPSWFH